MEFLPISEMQSIKTLISPAGCFSFM